MPIDAGRRMLTSKQSEQPGRCSPLHRYFEKTKISIEFISRWRFSTGPVLSHWQCNNPDGQRRFFDALNRHGILYSRQAYGVREHIYFLGPRGRQFGKQHLDDFKYFVRADQIRYASLRHSVLSQLAFQSLLTGRDLGERRRILMRARIEPQGGQKIPDIVLPYFTPAAAAPWWPDGLDTFQTLAVELESEPKSTDRIYAAFRSHLAAIAEGRHDRVVYYFTQPQHLDKYRDHYNQRLWPLPKWQPGKPQDSFSLGSMDPQGRPRILFTLLPDFAGCRTWQDVL